MKYTGDRSGEVELKDNSFYFIIPMKDGETVLLKDFPMPTIGDGGNLRYDEILFNDGKKQSYTGGWADGTGNSGSVGPSVDFRGYRNPTLGPIFITKEYGDEYGEKDKEFTLKLKGITKQEYQDGRTFITPINREFGYKINEKVEEQDSEDPTKTITTNKVVEEGTIKFDENGECFVKLKVGQTMQIDLGKTKYYDENGNERDARGETGWKRIDFDYFLDGDIVTVEEIDSENYDFNVDIKGKPGPRYTVTNTRKFLGKFSITNSVKGDSAEKDKDFRFKVKLVDSAEKLPNTYTYTGSKEGTIEFDENREAEITLKHGENITIEGLPVGAKYIVTEYDYQKEGYTTEGKEEEGIITEDGSLTEFINIKQPEEVVEDEQEEQKEDPIEEIVEEKEEVKQVQTGDVVTRAVIILAIALIAFGATYIKKKNK